MASPSWIRGQKYRMKHRSGMERRERVSVMTFLGKEDGNPARLQFDARPAGGTQSLSKNDIEAHWPVPMRTPHNIDGRE